jgi:hypothetical protein
VQDISIKKRLYLALKDIMADVEHGILHGLIKKEGTIGEVNLVLARCALKKYEEKSKDEDEDE